MVFGAVTRIITVIIGAVRALCARCARAVCALCENAPYVTKDPFYMGPEVGGSRAGHAGAEDPSASLPHFDSSSPVDCTTTAVKDVAKAPPVAPEDAASSSPAAPPMNGAGTGAPPTPQADNNVISEFLKVAEEAMGKRSYAQVCGDVRVLHVQVSSCSAARHTSAQIRVELDQI